MDYISPFHIINTLITIYFDMAPEETRMLEQAPPFRYAEAEDSIKIYELCFANMKRSDSTSMAKIAIMRGDEELQRWTMTMGEYPDT